jgi:Fe-S-cluster containining protein
MTEITGNPCIACIKSTIHGCCTIKGSCGLMLTKDEYERHFKRYEEDLVIWQSAKFYIISSKEGRICPNLENGGCRIYADRPIDCRLYPYVMRRFIDRGHKVKIGFHTKSDCPDKNTLFQITTQTQAKALIVEFGRKVYGKNTNIIVHWEKGVISRWRNKIEAAIVGHFRKRS